MRADRWRDQDRFAARRAAQRGVEHRSEHLDEDGAGDDLECEPRLCQPESTDLTVTVARRARRPAIVRARAEEAAHGRGLAAWRLGGGLNSPMRGSAQRSSCSEITLRGMRNSLNHARLPVRMSLPTGSAGPVTPGAHIGIRSTWSTAIRIARSATIKHNFKAALRVWIINPLYRRRVTIACTQAMEQSLFARRRLPGEYSSSAKSSRTAPRHTLSSEPCFSSQMQP